MTRVRAFGADTFRSLRSRNFRLFFSGQIISQTGTWMQMVAIGLLVLDLTDSGVAVGLVTAAQFLPILVLGAWGGVLADRRDRHRLLLTMNAIGAVVALAFALLVLSDAAELWSIYVLTFAAGTVTALENPTRRAFVTDLVDDLDVPNAVGLNSTLMTGSRVIGPAVAGALIAGPGIGWCFAVNAVSYIPQLGLFARMDRSQFRPAERVAKAKGQLRAGLQYVWREPDLRLPLLLVTAVGTLAFNFSVILPLFATRDLHGGPATFTTLFSVMSVGSVVGALTIARRTHADTPFLARCTLALGASMILLALAPVTAVALVAVVPVGITSVMVISGSNAVVQLGTDPAMRGRVLALLAVVFLGSTPIGGPIAGWVSETFGARWALGLGAATCLAAGALTLRALRARPEAVTRARRSSDVVPVDPSPVVVAPGR
ncbi:MAG: MFS transporter [Acidimicrobiales bacterium]